jgi:outer membrane lipoprotein SlyB
MNMPINTFPKHKAHPLMIGAGIAVILFCTAGIAAIMGWLPTSIGSNANDRALTQSEQLVAPPKQVPQTIPKQASAAPVHRKQTHTEPRPAAATPSKARCSNCGVVESTREITTRAQGSGVGAAGGAVVGGLLGNQVGGGRGKDIMTVVGAIGGAVAGNQIEGRVNATRSYEVIVRLDDGSTRAINQAAEPGWHAGDHVKIVDGVVRSNG